MMSEEMVMERSWSCTDGFSLEMTAKDVDGLDQISGNLAKGTIVAVPFLPNESDKTRIRMAAALRNGGFVPMPHIAARRISTQANLEIFLDGLVSAAKIDRLLIIAGDCPSPEGPYQDSIAVIKSGILPGYGIRRVAISGYPEGNPKIPTSRLQGLMVEKVAALAEQGIDVEIATQFSFSAEPVLEWLAQIRAVGITAPVRLGIPGPANLKTLLRYAAMCGVAASASVLARYGLSLTQLMGNTGPDKLVSAFSTGYAPDRHGEVYAHYYPFGGLKNLLSWLHRQNG